MPQLSHRINLTAKSRRNSKWTKQQIPETASSATFAFCFTKSSLALMFKRAADNFPVRVCTSVTTSSFDAASEMTSGDGTI